MTYITDQQVLINKIILNGVSPEWKELNELEGIYENQQYEGKKLPPFDVDYTNPKDPNSYVPMCKRKPIFIDNVAKKIVNTCVSHLFGEERFPKILCEDEDGEKQTFLDEILSQNDGFKLDVLEATRTALKMRKCLFIFKIIEGRFYFKIYNWKLINEVMYDAKIPDKINFIQLRWSEGEFDKLRNEIVYYWYQREFTENAEIVYNRVEIKEENNGKNTTIPKFTVNTEQTIYHNFGFVPGVIFKTEDEKAIYEDQAECGNFNALHQYLSVIFCGSRAVMSPQLVGEDLDGGEFNAGTGTVWNTSQGSNLRYLSAGMQGYDFALTNYDKMRSLILDSCRIIVLGDAVSSGEALKIRYIPQTGLIEELRITFGEKCLKELIKKMYLAAIKIDGKMDFDDDVIIPTDEKIKISLKWQPLFSNSIDDKIKNQQLITISEDRGYITHEVAIDHNAMLLDIDNTTAMKEELEKELKYAMAEIDRQTNANNTEGGKDEEKNAIGDESEGDKENNNMKNKKEMVKNESKN